MSNFDDAAGPGEYNILAGTIPGHKITTLDMRIWNITNFENCILHIDNRHPQNVQLRFVLNERLFNYYKNNTGCMCEVTFEIGYATIVKVCGFKNNSCFATCEIPREKISHTVFITFRTIELVFYTNNSNRINSNRINSNRINSNRI